MSKFTFSVLKGYNFARHVLFSRIQIQGPLLRPLSSIATFEDVKGAKNNPNVIVIDVREPSELQETGVIPGSINIPLGNVEDAFKSLKNDEFQKLYGHPKPTTDSSIIFSCRLGKRSQTALETVQKLGYNNVRNYQGGWLEWEERASKK